jgi:hypothetical protein
MACTANADVVSLSASAREYNDIYAGYIHKENIS